jgi:hypothetical protein
MLPAVERIVAAGCIAAAGRIVAVEHIATKKK